MRALLCLALLALLAAPSLAGPAPGGKPPGGKPGPKPGPKPHPPKPFKVSGAILADGLGIEFLGKKINWGSAGTNEIDIVSNYGNTPPGVMGWQLVGKTVAGSKPDSESVYSVNWAFGAVVKTEVNTTTGALAVTLFGDKGPRPIRPCRDLQLGPKVTISYEAERHRDRKVEIVVRPFIKITLVQPFIKPLNRWQKGEHAPFLNVFVTLTEEPKEELTGLLVPELPQA